jgi:hypothetical protein
LWKRHVAAEYMCIKEPDLDGPVKQNTLFFDFGRAHFFRLFIFPTALQPKS